MPPWGKSESGQIYIYIPNGFSSYNYIFTIRCKLYLRYHLLFDCLLLTMVTQKTGFNKYKNLTVLSSTVKIDIGTKDEIQVKIVQGRISFFSLRSPGSSSCFIHSSQPFFLVKD